MQENKLNIMYKTCITDLYELKQRLRTELSKLDHVVIVAAVRQWRRRLSLQRASRPVMVILSTVSDFRHFTASNFLLQVLTTHSSQVLLVGMCFRRHLTHDTDTICENERIYCNYLIIPHTSRTKISPHTCIKTHTRSAYSDVIF